jgi:hypothetical protein
MKNFFFAPSKATVDSDDALRYLESVGKVRVAEPDTKKNRETLHRLKLSAKRADVEVAACVLTAPSCNSLLSGGMEIRVGRGITDIGMDALYQEIPTFVILKQGDQWLFYPVISFSQAGCKGDWKIDYSTAILELPIVVGSLAVFIQTREEELFEAKSRLKSVMDADIPF